MSLNAYPKAVSNELAQKIIAVLVVRMFEGDITKIRGKIIKST
jgi:hypothetical protein